MTWTNDWSEPFPGRSCGLVVVASKETSKLVSGSWSLIEQGLAPWHETAELRVTLLSEPQASAERPSGLLMTLLQAGGCLWGG